MKTLAALLVLAVSPALAVAQATKEDLKKLAKAGISEDVILAYIKANGYQGKPTSDDLVELKEAGLTDRLLTGLLSPAEIPAPAPAAPSEPAAPSTTVYVQPTTVSAYPTGYLSVGATYTYPSSYCYPTYRRYYTGTWHRPYYYSYSSYRPTYYRSSSYCGPRYSFSYSRSHCRSGSGVRVRW